jgi:TonB-linked SusC/RagA family outer membrane protein
MISGKVTSSEDGSAIPGATVLVKGTTVGMTTDLDGTYKLLVPENANTLVFSFVGMKSKTVPVGTSNTINVVLEPDVLSIEGVVVTALGIARETKALGYSVEAVGGEELAKSGEVNAIQSLASKASGVQVIGSGGTPGASSKILVRGNSSFTGENQPLIVVDGVPIDNATAGSVAGDYPYNSGLSGVNNSNRAIDINPEDIESVTVLKGPAAAALYGVRAGNGAIVYTTKRGKASKGIRVTYGVNLDLSTVNKLPELQTTYAQGAGGGQIDPDGNPTVGVYQTADPGPDMTFFTADDISYGTANSWGPKIEDLDGVEAVDNMDKFFETATSWTHNLTFTGGNDENNFRLALSQLDQTGIVPNTDFSRTSVRITADSRLSDKFKVGGTVNYIKSGGTKAQNGSNLSGTMLSLTRAPASFDLKGEGEEGYLYPNGNQRQYFYAYDNPYWSVYKNPFNDDIHRVMGNFSIDYIPFTWLTATYRLGTDNYTDQRKQIFAIGSLDPPEPTGEVWENIQRYREVYSDLLVTASKDFTDKVFGSLTVGNNLNHRHRQDLFGRGRTLNVPNFYNLSNASSLYASENTVKLRSAALFFDANLEYNNLVYLNVTGRNEWSSTFGQGQNNFFYPSVSASFVFSELIPENSILSFGKLRLAYAQAGNAPPVYSSTTYFTQPFLTDGFTDGLSFPFMGYQGFGYSSVLGNPDLKPERNTSTEIGFDLRFLTGRLNLDLTFYNQQADNILVQRPIAPTTGFSVFLSNSGKMENRGIELVLSGDPVKTKDFNWNIRVNFTRNKNEVLELAEGVDEINIESAFVSIGSYAIVGDAYGALYGTRWKRDDAGNLLINPATGLPMLDPERGNIGNPFPDWTAGIRNSFTWKGLSLSALLDIREGGDIWCGTIARLHQIGRTEESADRERTYIIPGKIDGTGEDNNIEISAYSYYRGYVGDLGSAAVEQAVFDGSWVRLREVTLSYRLDLKEMLPVVQYAEFSLTGRNLWLSTDYPGVDPETSLTGAGSNLTGFDYFNMPSTKSFAFGLRVGF